MNVKVSYAVFCRNFVNYFANPLGYLFICLFVLVGGIAPFGPTSSSPPTWRTSISLTPSSR